MTQRGKWKPSHAGGLHGVALDAVPWERASLARHYAKHPAGIDKLCWNHLLNISSRHASEDQYLERAVRAWEKGWIGFRAEMLNRDSYRPSEDRRIPYHQEALYAIDHSLITVAVDPAWRQIRTCFHEHFDRGHSTEENVSGNTEMKLNYMTHLGHRLASKTIKCLRDIVVNLPKGRSGIVTEEIALLRTRSMEASE